MPNSKVSSFKQELKALLEKYNADISFEVAEGSDTYGIYDARMEATIVDILPDGKRSYETIVLSNDWCVDNKDL